MQFKLRKHHHNNNNPFWPILTRQCSKCILFCQIVYTSFWWAEATILHTLSSADSEADSEETLSLALRIWGSDRASCVVFYFLVKLSSFSCNLVLLLGKGQDTLKSGDTFASWVRPMMSPKSAKSDSDDSSALALESLCAPFHTF